MEDVRDGPAYKCKWCKSPIWTLARKMSHQRKCSRNPKNIRKKLGK